MSNFLAQIAERIINQPLLIMPEKLAMIAEVLEGRINIDASDLLPKMSTDGGEPPKPMGSRYVGEFQPKDPGNARAERKPYRTTAEGVAIIPVHGSLVNRGGYLDAMSGITSYEKIKYQVGEAALDGAVKQILLDIDSPGGEAVGAFEVADAVRAAAQVKTVISLGNGFCCSAAYAIGCGGTKVVTSRSSVIGSIGTVILHLDRSRQLADMGIKPTLIAIGKRKGDGSPYFELSDEVKGELRSYALRINSLFVSTVESNRSGLNAEAIMNMEAGVFIGSDAVDRGLADEVGSFESVLAEMHRGVSRTIKAKPRGFLMAQETQAPEASASGITQAQMDSAVAAARSEGHKAGATAERDRFKAVTGAEHYAGRQTSALHMLTTTDMSAEAINGVLAGLPAGQAAAPAKPEGERSKDAAGGLVVDAQGDNGPVPDASAAWSKSVQKANSRFG